VFLPQDLDGVGVGVPGVHDQGQAGLARSLDMGPEGGLLARPGRVFVVVIQPGLADPDHLMMGGQGDQALGA
jgi:hypothetical protein